MPPVRQRPFQEVAFFMGTVETATIEDLIRTLIKSAPHAKAPRNEPHSESTGEEIIFDLDVDGARYLLVRLPKPGQVPVALSPREQEIVRLVSLGHSNKVIAAV